MYLLDLLVCFPGIALAKNMLLASRLLRLQLFRFVIILVLVLSYVENGNAGLTSTFVRTQWPAADIPLDNEVFAIPKGYNAPQQVSLAHFTEF